MYGNGFVVRKFYEITCLLETFIIITNSLRSNSVIIMNYAVRTSLRTSMNSCRVLLHTVLFHCCLYRFLRGFTWNILLWVIRIWYRTIAKNTVLWYIVVEEKPIMALRFSADLLAEQISRTQERFRCEDCSSWCHRELCLSAASLLEWHLISEWDEQESWRVLVAVPASQSAWLLTIKWFRHSVMVTQCLKKYSEHNILIT